MILSNIRSKIYGKKCDKIINGKFYKNLNENDKRSSFRDDDSTYTIYSMSSIIQSLIFES